MSKRGMILVMTLFVTGLVVLFTAALVDMFRQQKMLLDRGVDSYIALAAAEAGIDEAIHQLRLSRTWNTGIYETLSSQATVKVTFDTSQSPYSTNNADAVTTVTGWNNRPLIPGGVHIVSVGTFNGVTRQQEALLELPPRFDNVVFAQQTIALGPSISANLWKREWPHNSYDGGNLATNLATAGAVQLTSGDVIQGNIQVGPGGSSSTIVGNATYDSCVVATNTSSFPYRTVPTRGTYYGDQVFSSYAGSTIPPGIYGNVTIADVDVRLDGTYVFLGNLTMANNASLRSLGEEVNVFLNGNLSAGENCGFGGQYRGAYPMDVIPSFYGTPNCTSISVGNQSSGWEWPVALDCPNADVTFGSGQRMFGGWIVKSFQMSGNGNLDYYSPLAAGNDRVALITRW